MFGKTPPTPPPQDPYLYIGSVLSALEIHMTRKEFSNMSYTNLQGGGGQVISLNPRSGPKWGVCLFFPDINPSKILSCINVEAILTSNPGSILHVSLL